MQIKRMLRLPQILHQVSSLSDHNAPMVPPTSQIWTQAENPENITQTSTSSV